MAKRCRTDSNQKEILKKIDTMSGITYASLTNVGNGVPDLLIGYKGKNYLIEVKPPDGNKKQRSLRDTQVKWHKEWKGQVKKVFYIEDILEEINYKEIK